MRDPDSELPQRPQLGPSAADLGLQCSVPPSPHPGDEGQKSSADGGRGRLRITLAQGLHRGVHIYRVTYNPRQMLRRVWSPSARRPWHPPGQECH